MLNLYRNESSYPKNNAQRNLSGRTHYVDDDTLRFHKSRILSTHIPFNGLLFALVESCAIDPDNRQRGFRYVILDTLGNTVDRPKLDECYKTRKAATAAMWNVINGLDAVAINTTAIERARDYAARDYADGLAELAKIQATEKAAA